LQLVINILVTAALALMAGLSSQIIISAFRHFHAGIAVAASIGGYLFFLLSSGGLLPIVVAGAVALVIATIAGIAFDALLLAKLRLDGARTLGLFLISLAGWLVVQSLISILIGNEIHGILVEDRKAWHLLGAVITRKQLLVIVLPLVAVIILYWRLQKSPWGLIFRGYCSNPLLLNNFGISRVRGELLSGALGFFCAACAGILEAIEFGIAPTSGFRIWLVGTVVFVVAGVGNIKGLVLAALLISFISHVMAYWIGGEWIQASMFAVLIAFLLWRPLGMSGRLLRKIEI
jgi:branched-chain amino acid transport system permease protein